MLTLCACGGAKSSASSKEEQKQVNYGLYIKDSEFFFTDLKNEPWQISSRLVDDDDIEDEDLAFSGNKLSYYITVSSDHSIVFFPDKVSNDDEGINLYYRKTNNKESEATKIDSDVTIYKVNSSASIVTYAKGKGEDCNLYQYSIKEDTKEKIASSVTDYYVSEDGSKILYVNTDGALYLKSKGADKEKIASDITSVVYHSEDFAMVYYIKDEALYKQSVGADREKIDSEIGRIVKVYESGEVYYLKQNSESLTLMDYVVDDMKEADANAPDEYPSRPRSYNYNTTEEYNKAYAKYEEAYEAYYAKASRDYWRETLAETKLSHTIYSLYFYNGSEKTAITESFAGDISSVAAAQNPVISYAAYNQETLNKTKLSELAEADDFSGFYDKIEKALFSSSDRYIAVGATASVLKQEQAAAIRINESGTAIYYVDDIPEGKNVGELYSVSIVENVVGEPELYDSDVYAGACYFLSDTQFLYFKDYKDANGDLYLNKAKVDYDVCSNNLSYNDKLEKIYYYSDWDNEKGYGTLKEYANGESVKIADDVHSYSYTTDGKVLYLYDYSLKYYAGELHLWDNGESQKIDDDVIFLVPPFSHGDYIQQVQKMLNAVSNYTYGYTTAPAEAPAAAW